MSKAKKKKSSYVFKTAFFSTEKKSFLIYLSIGKHKKYFLLPLIPNVFTSVIAFACSH